MPYFCQNLERTAQKSSAAVVIGALRNKIFFFFTQVHIWILSSTILTYQKPTKTVLPSGNWNTRLAPTINSHNWREPACTDLPRNWRTQKVLNLLTTGNTTQSVRLALSLENVRKRVMRPYTVDLLSFIWMNLKIVHNKLCQDLKHCSPPFLLSFFVFPFHGTYSWNCISDLHGVTHVPLNKCYALIIPPTPKIKCASCTVKLV